MGATKNDLRYIVSVPSEVYTEIKELKNVKYLSVRDYDMYHHYKNDAEWQEAEYYYKLSREKRQKIEDNIDFKMINNNEQ